MFVWLCVCVCVCVARMWSQRRHSWKLNPSLRATWDFPSGFPRWAHRWSILTHTHDHNIISFSLFHSVPTPQCSAARRRVPSWPTLVPMMPTTNATTTKPRSTAPPPRTPTSAALTFSTYYPRISCRPTAADSFPTSGLPMGATPAGWACPPCRRPKTS